MNEWSLSNLLQGLHDDIQQKLGMVRQTMGNAVAKGDASERVWLEMLKLYLPARYQVERAFIIDSNDVCSKQIDVVIFDRQYSPFILNFQGEKVVPAESVYAAFEAKQVINADTIKDAKEKIGSVRRLHRTSLPIPHAGGVYPPKALPHILGGILSFESDWRPAFGQSLQDSLKDDHQVNLLDFGCIAAHGYFERNAVKGDYTYHSGGKAATAFLFKLISRLQLSATVPMIDIMAYAEWLAS